MKIDRAYPFMRSPAYHKGSATNTTKPPTERSNPYGIRFSLLVVGWWHWWYGVTTRRQTGRVLVVHPHSTNVATNIRTPASIGFAGRVGGLVSLVANSVRIRDFADLERGKRCALI
ncbi:hypothetical protein [Paraburkholderia sp. GAS348]|uniref:hypothetical protein n=1 Tax=Paraburkholderia sp. GAS348 TaxID=3035132 RepID=UPI003D239451